MPRSKNVLRRNHALEVCKKEDWLVPSVFRKNPEVENPDPNPNSDPNLSIFLASFAQMLAVEIHGWFLLLSSPKMREKKQRKITDITRNPSGFHQWHPRALSHRSGRLSQVLIATADGWRLHPKSRIFGALKIGINAGVYAIWSFQDLRNNVAIATKMSFIFKFFLGKFTFIYTKTIKTIYFPAGNFWHLLISLELSQLLLSKSFSTLQGLYIAGPPPPERGPGRWRTSSNFARRIRKAHRKDHLYRTKSFIFFLLLRIFQPNG